MGMLAENKKGLSLRKGGRGEIAEKMRNMRNREKREKIKNGYSNVGKIQKIGGKMVLLLTFESVCAKIRSSRSKRCGFLMA